MSPMAVVSMEGVGLAYDAAKISPVTWVDVENVPLGSSTSEKPVMKVAAAGLSPMFPASKQFEITSVHPLAGKYATGLRRRTNRGRGDIGHSCLGENCEISSRAQVNGWRSSGVGAVRDGLQVKKLSEMVVTRNEGSH
jgi:hypothetical protein